MSEQEDKLITELRTEANELKECFTRFSFQAIAFSAVVFGLLASKPVSSFFGTIASITVTSMLLLVARIGTYKYGNANTLYGFQLHLERTRTLGETNEGWKNQMRSIGWEEAVRSWRVIQPTLFRYLYYWHPLAPNWLRREHQREHSGARWFEPHTLVKEANVGASYYPGGYLRLTAMMLHTLASISTFPIAYLSYHKYGEDKWVAITLLCAFIVSLIIVILRIIYDNSRITVLEKGLLSIHSSAVLWQAVVLAHYKALDVLKRGEGAGLENYTKNLALQASDLRDHVFSIDCWLGYRKRGQVEEKAGILP